MLNVEIDSFLPERSKVPALSAPLGVGKISPIGVEVNPLVAFDIALGVQDLEAVRTKHKLSEAQFQDMTQHPPFIQLVTTYQETLKESGLTFKLKAALQAEALMDTTLWNMATDALTPAQVRLDYFKVLAKLGDLEPKNAGVVTGEGFKLIINLNGVPSAPSGTIIDVVPPALEVADG